MTVPFKDAVVQLQDVDDKKTTESLTYVVLVLTDEKPQSNEIGYRFTANGESSLLLSLLRAAIRRIENDQKRSRN